MSDEFTTEGGQVFVQEFVELGSDLTNEQARALLARALAAEQALTEARAESAIRFHDARDFARQLGATEAERDAARAELAALRERIENDLSEWAHQVSPDCWYTCPAATVEREGETCCDDDAGSECNCGLELRQARLHAALAAPVEPRVTDREDRR